MKSQTTSLALCAVVLSFTTMSSACLAKSSEHAGGTKSGAFRTAVHSSIKHASASSHVAPIMKSLNGVTTVEEEVDGKTYHIGRTIVNASPENVFAVITDYDHSTKLFDNLKKATIVATNPENGTTDVSFSLKGLANVWNFDYVLRMKETYPSLIEFERVSGAFKANQGYWKFEPLDAHGKKTLVTYAKFIDGGMLPQSMVKKQVKDAMPTVMANVKATAEARATQVSLK